MQLRCVQLRLSFRNQGDNDTTASNHDALSLSLYRVTFVARDRLDLPAYLGSTLRGAFGHVFRTLACPGRFEEPCPIPDNCPYHLIFETSPPPGAQALRTHEEIPRPFVIAPITNGTAGWLESGRNVIEPGSELSFDLTLIGRAQEYFPYFVVALREIDRLGRRNPYLARPGEAGAQRRVRVPDAGRNASAPGPTMPAESLSPSPVGQNFSDAISPPPENFSDALSPTRESDCVVCQAIGSVADRVHRLWE
ncbi:MAG: hypothetical protein ACLQU2_19840 [Candidatus Binataceae bacterium]